MHQAASQKCFFFVLWNSLELPFCLCFRLEGIYFLKSYIDSTGSLTAGKMKQEVWGNMLTGKKYPQCVRAQRLLVQKFPCPILQDEHINCRDMMQEYLTGKSEKTTTSKLWVGVLRNLFFLAFQFCTKTTKMIDLCFLSC